MEIHLIEILRSSVALLAGGVIGLGFGAVQAAAQRRYEKRQQEGKFKDGWSVMPGSGKRVAGLLIVLAAIQFFCPLLFTAGTQWLVSGGLIAGYGWTLFQKLMVQRKASRA
ncbi:MAG TPA: hypothetical protein VMI53_01520 [Opitutaceae bacterium]|nr:hypothetical protein [Opitutaceae bacterium]